MDLVQSFIERARRQPLRVVFPEGDDERIVQAAAKIRALGIAEPIVLNASDLAADPRLDGYVTDYLRGSNVKEAVARKMIKRPLFFGGMMVKQGHADAMVGGATCATATFIQAASLTVGFQAGINTPSSFFLMILPDKVLVFADCAVNIAPTAPQLAEIAIATALNAQQLLGTAPKVAFLSFSTKGSASHADTEKVIAALDLAKRMRPDIAMDGELQADAAIVPRVGERKAPGSPVAGTANVLIFPDLDAGNIAYKLVQYCAGAKALGPILQGFAKPMNDLSRGATVDDIVGVTAITVVRGQK